MMIRDERHEVAARLRAQARTVSHDSGYLWQRLEIAVNGWRLGAVVDESYVFYNDVLSRLADLIDPTCRFFPTFNGGFGCDRCYTWIQSMKTKPNYCPICGARLPSDCASTGETRLRAGACSGR